MRRRVAMAAVFLTLLAALPLYAQQQSTSFTGANPANIKLVPINTNAALRSIQRSNMLRTPQTSSPLSLSNLMSKLPLPNWALKSGTSNGVPPRPPGRRPTR